MIPGANLIKTDECSFTVWAPNAKSVKVLFEDDQNNVGLERREFGYWHKKIEGVTFTAPANCSSPLRS